MRNTRRRSGHLDVWPALADTMLAFLLVVVVLLVFQVARNIDISSDEGLRIRQQVEQDQAKVAALVEELRARYGAIEIAGIDGNTQEITLGSEALFESASADLSRRGTALLGDLVRRIVAEEIGTLKEVTVKGHTDDIAISTVQFPSNWELSTARASRVVRFLTEAEGRQGIDPNDVTLVAAGYGEFVPISATNRARNRRIELRLVYTNQSDLTSQTDLADLP